MKKAIIGAVLTFSSLPVLAKSMSCYVDTPAYDNFTTSYCSAAIFDGPRTTSAVFRIDNPHSNIHSVIWSDSACSSSSTSCITTVRAYNPKTVTATVLKTDGTYFQVSATAEYELGF